MACDLAKWLAKPEQTNFADIEQQEDFEANMWAECVLDEIHQHD